MGELILGLDAAWRDGNPSGIALMEISPDSSPILLRATRSCKEFTSQRDLLQKDWLTRPYRDDMLNIKELVKTCFMNTGKIPGIIALDIPLSPEPIEGRRKADNEIAVRFGAKKAGVHIYSAKRYGNTSVRLFRELSELGYIWLDTSSDCHLKAPTGYFLETCTHPAIIRIMNLEERLPYKVSKRREYWPELSAEEQRKNIARNLDMLRNRLSQSISDVHEKIPSAVELLRYNKSNSDTVLKGIEDALDAVVCAMVGYKLQCNKAEVTGDELSAIWIPKEEGENLIRKKPPHCHLQVHHGT